MRRKIYDKMLDWKNNSNGKTALLIDGARRVGKSYIAKEFAEKNYRSYILIDFNKVPDEIKNLFNNYLDNLEDFFMYLTNYYNIKLYERQSVIIFDEVQLFPRARSAIKYLVEDGRYDYIETGSLVSIKENVQDILIPSEERHLKLYPFDFEEFLWALGNENLMDVIKKCFDEKKSIDNIIHRKAMDYFRKYMIVGGMPQVIQEFLLSNDFNRVDEIKQDILNLYRDDIKKHSGKYSLKVEEIFDNIPGQLSKHEKKFNITSLNKDAKNRDYGDAFLWLNDAMIVNMAYKSTEPSVGLRLNEDSSSYKCYMADTGLLISLAFNDNSISKEEVYKNILFDKLEFNAGMLIENVVSQMLVTNGHRLYFYSNNSNEADDRMEIDFLISKSKVTKKHNISAIEVKSGKNYTTVSLNKLYNKYSSMLDTSYIIHTGNYMVKNDIVYLPIYMTPLL